MRCAMVRMSHPMASIAHDGIRAAGGVDLEQEQRSFQTLAGLCAPVARASARVLRSLACRPSPRHPGLHRLDHHPNDGTNDRLSTLRTTRGGHGYAAPPAAGREHHALLSFGFSTDQRPDLLQFKPALGTGDPAGAPSAVKRCPAMAPAPPGLYSPGSAVLQYSATTLSVCG